MDPDVLDIFEEETGIQVVYEEYETNEIMYPKVQSGAIAYDVVCPSDYMIQRMIENDLLAEINWDNIPNIKNIGTDYHGSVQSSLIRKINTLFLIAGVLSGSFTTRPW